MIFQLKTWCLRPAVEAYLNLYWTNNDRWSEANVEGRKRRSSTKTSWRHLMLEIFKASLFQRSTQIGRDFLDGPFSHRNESHTAKTHCVGREFSATDFKGTKKEHELSSEWKDKTSQLRSPLTNLFHLFFGRVAFQKVWKYSSLTLPTSKSWRKSTWSNVPWVFSQDFSLFRPRLEPRHLPGTFHLGVFYTTQPNHSPFKELNFLGGRIWSSFTIFLGGRQTKFLSAGFLGGLFGQQISGMAKDS